jgi:peptidoglycan hydrolase-like protein with peptidoglycan-binding domain
MKLIHLFLASAAAVSLGAVAADESRQEPQAQGGQTQAQTPATTAGESSQAQAQTAQTPSADAIKQAQEKLTAQGHDIGGPADGKLGPKTQAAVKAYQQSKGLKASGQLDQPTLAALGASSEGAASTGASSATPGASGQSSTGATTSPKQSPAAPSSSSSSQQPKSEEQPKGKSGY